MVQWFHIVVVLVGVEGFFEQNSSQLVDTQRRSRLMHVHWLQMSLTLHCVPPLMTMDIEFTLEGMATSTVCQLFLKLV